MKLNHKIRLIFTKKELIKIQEKSKYGYVIGKTKKDDMPNGTKNKPLFNLKPIDD